MIEAGCGASRMLPGPGDGSPPDPNVCFENLKSENEGD